MDRERVDGWCERGILGLVLLILVTGPLALGGVTQEAATAWRFLMLQGLTLGVMLLWAARLWISPRPQFLWPPVCWAVLAFVAYAVARYLQADIEYVARQELVRIVVYAFLFFAILNNLHRQDATQIITFTLVFLGMGISGYAIWQFATGSDRVWDLVSTYKGRAAGTFYNPNNLAGFLEMLVPLALAHVLVGRLSHVTKICLGYAALVMIVAIGFTMSRGGWVVTGLVLAALCGVLLFHRNYRVQALVLLVVLGVSAYYLAPKVTLAQARFKNTFSSGKADDDRFNIWGPAWRMWQDNFWWGVGPGEFDYRFREYRPENFQMRPDRVHNDYLNTLVDYGLAGTLLVAAAWGLLVAGICRTWKFVRAAPDDFARRKSNKFAFMLGAALALGGLLVHSMVDFNLHIPSNAILTVALMALLASQWRFATERWWFRAGTASKIVATVVLLGGAVALGYAGWRSARECRYARQAAREIVRGIDFSSARIATLKLAWAAEPANFNTTYAIAESLRLQSREGGGNYEALAKEAMEWYQRGMKLNPHDGYNWLGYGLCLDWISGPEEKARQVSAPFFRRALELDPNGYFTTANLGLHYVELEDFAAARTCFERSLKLEPAGNGIAANYLPIVERRLVEAAAGH